MGNVQLLDKTRKINKLLHNGNSDKVIFDEICKVFSEIIASNVLVLSRNGMVLGAGCMPGINQLTELVRSETGSQVDADFNDRLLNVLSTKENVNLETLGFTYGTTIYKALITPVDIAGERLGTIFTYKMGADYGIDDIILCEYIAAVVGLEMMRSVNEENSRKERDARAARSAVGSLSESEQSAFIQLLDKLPDHEGTIVISRIADEAGITRSVVVNAVKKLESARVIRGRSLGMRGTRVQVLNNAIYDEAEKLKSKQ